MKKNSIFCIMWCILLSTNSYSQLTTLLNFTGASNGSSPRGSLISDGTFLYGMTELGGANNLGTIFKIKPDGTGYQKLLDFDGTLKGSNPKGSLYFDGTFLYGMTKAGGNTNIGTIFKIKPDGTSFLKLFDFASATGSAPEGSLISDGTFLYGMTTTGQKVFKIKPDGTNYVILYSFNFGISGYPQESLFYDGNFLYGLTGTSNIAGTIFKIKTDGTGFVTLKVFLINGSSYPDGFQPVGHLISDETFLYGVTGSGGSFNSGTIFKIKPDGTGFQVIYNFTTALPGGGCGYPSASLFYDGSTYLYGTAAFGGAGGLKLFKIKRDGTNFQNFYSFTGSTFNNQTGNLISDGTYLYGMSTGGNGGSVFKYQYCNISAPTVSSNGPVCTGNTLSLTASTVTGSTYTWTGPNGFTSTEQNPIVSTNATTAMGGIYICVAQIDGCSSQASIDVIINQATAGNNGPVCSGNTLSLTASSIPGATYFWTGPNGFSSTSQNPTVSLTTSAMAGVYSVYTVANGCTNPTPGTTTVVINPIPSSATASNNGPVCIGNILLLTASTITGATYSWTGPNGFTSTAQNPTISTSATATMGGFYSVIATVNGCSSIASTTTVEINKVTATNNGSVCVGNILSLFATPISGAVYSWTGPNGFTSSNQNPTVSTSATSAMAGVYGVASTVNGCTSAASVTIVTVNPAIANPTGNISQNFIQGQTLSNLQVTGTNLTWYANQTDAVNHANPILNSTLLVNGATYYVTQTNNGCESSSLAITATVALGLTDFLKDRFTYYPNPVNTILNFENNNTISIITLFNFLGQVIQENEINSLTGQLDMSKLPIGNYLLRFKTDNGDTTIKLIKY